MATVYRPVHLHRMAKSDPPEREDFLSREGQGLGPPDDREEARRLNSGVSMFATEQQARNKAQRYPFLGRHIARLEIPDDAPILVERTTESRGDYTAWGDPDELRKYVVSVVPV